MAELAICDDWGIGHTAFLELPVEDQAKALAYRDWKASLCRTCGTEPSEWDPKQGGRRDAYIAGQVHCEGDVVLAQENANITELAKSAGDQAAAGLRAVLIPRALAPDVDPDDDDGAV